MKRFLLLSSLLLFFWIGGACAPSLELEKTRGRVGAECESVAGQQVVIGIIMPHHDLASELIEDAWQLALEAAPAMPELIVLIGPDHPGLADHPLIWTEGMSASLQISISLLAQDWIESGVGGEALVADHSIESPLKFLPEEAREIPLLALTVPRGLDSERTSRIIDEIQTLSEDKQLLVVGSVDFSHGLSSEDAKGKDQESWFWIQNREMEAIKNAGNEYFDSPEAIEILLRCLEGEPEQMIRSDSSDFGWSKTLPGTSYQIIYLNLEKNS